MMLRRRTPRTPAAATICSHRHWSGLTEALLLSSLSWADDAALFRCRCVCVTWRRMLLADAPAIEAFCRRLAAARRWYALVRPGGAVAPLAHTCTVLVREERHLHALATDPKVAAHSIRRLVFPCVDSLADDERRHHTPVDGRPGHWRVREPRGRCWRVDVNKTRPDGSTLLPLPDQLDDGRAPHDLVAAPLADLNDIDHAGQRFDFQLGGGAWTQQSNGEQTVRLGADARSVSVFEAGEWSAPTARLPETMRYPNYCVFRRVGAALWLAWCDPDSLDPRDPTVVSIHPATAAAARACRLQPFPIINGQRLIWVPIGLALGGLVWFATAERRSPDHQTDALWFACVALPPDADGGGGGDDDGDALAVASVRVPQLDDRDGAQGRLGLGVHEEIRVDQSRLYMMNSFARILLICEYDARTGRIRPPIVLRLDPWFPTCKWIHLRTEDHRGPRQHVHGLWQFDAWNRRHVWPAIGRVKRRESKFGSSSFSTWPDALVVWDMAAAPRSPSGVHWLSFACALVLIVFVVRWICAA